MTLSRKQLADRALELAGGATGYTVSFDPLGHFDYVTEGRQKAQNAVVARWVANGRKGDKPVHFSACQELAVCLCWEACGKPSAGVPWCNRVAAGNTWIPGQNLLRIKSKAPFAWHAWAPRGPWRAQLADPVEVMGHYGPHTVIVTEIRYDANGSPSSVDVAQYGQFIDPDGPGPEQANDGCDVRTGLAVTRDSLGRWCINGNWVIGHVDIAALQDHEAAGDTDPAPPPSATPVPRDEQTTLPDLGQTSRVLRVGAVGPDVAALRKQLGLPPGSAFDGGLDAAVKRFQAVHALVVDGVVGPRTWAALRAAP